MAFSSVCLQSLLSPPLSSPPSSSRHFSNVALGTFRGFQAFFSACSMLGSLVSTAGALQRYDVSSDSSSSLVSSSSSSDWEEATACRMAWRLRRLRAIALRNCKVTDSAASEALNERISGRAQSASWALRNQAVHANAPRSWKYMDWAKQPPLHEAEKQQWEAHMMAPCA